MKAGLLQRQASSVAEQLPKLALAKHVTAQSNNEKKAFRYDGKTTEK